MAEGVVVNRITLWQGQQWHESESGVNAAVLCMTPAPDGATLVIAGEFTSVSGSTAQHVVESGCTLAIKGDVNGDGAVNVTDLRAVIQFWGPRAPNPSACPANIAPPTSGDGHVNVTELLLVMSDWRP